MTDIEGVIPALGQALEKRGFTALTPVQEAVLAPELADSDTLVSAQTGSGKTVAFGLALAPTLLMGEERFVDAEAPLALVVAPTRELALQVKRELEWLYAMTGALHASCVGGMDMRTERRALQRGVHIVVGTPGRLRDHIERGSLDVGALKAVVLDEADEMLDMGFRDELETILKAAPEDRRTLLFSATVSKQIARLAASFQRDAIRVNTISPGLIARPGLEEDWPDGVERWRRAAPLTRLGTPEDVGDACVFLSSDLSRWITGTDLIVDGGVLARPTW